MTAVNSKSPGKAGKGKAFFDRGDEVAETGNWDFAIQMYLEGIRREPGNLDRGHRPLREVSLKRKAHGGKGAGILEQFKRRGGKEPIEALINAEYLLAKDPGNLSHMRSVLKAAQQLDQRELVKWICDLLFDAVRQAKRPSKRTLVTIAEAYGKAEEYVSAVQACDMALRIDPNDGDLQEMAKNFSARATIKQGQYDVEGTFVKSVRDMSKQVELAQRDHLTQSRDFLEKDIENARTDYEASPEVPGKVDRYVEALLKIEEESYENEAIDVLKKAHADTGAYRFKMRMDDVKNRQMRRQYNKLVAAGDKQAALELARKILDFELQMYAERAENYPTDLGVKFELGRRQLQVNRIDEAIASLQQGQRDPKRRIPALQYLGQAFSKKGWRQVAVETYEKALELEPSNERAKEIHYCLGQELRALGEKAKALDHFSRVAQMDFTYRDVRDQVEALQKEME